MNQDPRILAMEEIRECYQEPRIFLNKDIKEKFGVGMAAVSRLVKEVAEEIGVTPLYIAMGRGGYNNYLKQSNVKNYTRNGGKYRVYKQIKGEVVSFGQYETEEIAIRIVDELRNVGWDKSKLEGILEKLGLNKTPSYCRKHAGKYMIHKRVGGKIMYFGGYDDEGTAQMVVHELKLVDWDKSRLNEIKEKLGVV